MKAKIKISKRQLEILRHFLRKAIKNNKEKIECYIAHNKIFLFENFFDRAIKIESIEKKFINKRFYIKIDNYYNLIKISLGGLDRNYVLETFIELEEIEDDKQKS